MAVEDDDTSICLFAHELWSRTPQFDSSNPKKKNPTHHIMADNDVREEPFPASSKQITGTVNGIQTEISRVDFSDKIVITVSQAGRLAQWVSW